MELFSFAYRWILAPIIDNVIKRPRLTTDVDLEHNTSSDPCSSYGILRGSIQDRLNLEAEFVVGNSATLFVTIRNLGKVPALIHEIGIEVFYSKRQRDREQRFGIFRNLMRRYFRRLGQRDLMYFFFESECDESFKISSKTRDLRVREAEAIRVIICRIALLSMFLEKGISPELVVKPFLTVHDSGSGRIQHNSIMKVRNS